MKRMISFTFSIVAVLLLSGITVFAQVPVELHINHKLSGSNFAFGTTKTNSLGNNFNVTRLQYYISRISITHDGGTVTNIPNHYILVDAATTLQEALGNYPITSVESVSFFVGVDTPTNHMDPSAQPSGHPLEPKSPSMHWGWTSGYIFVAMDGKSGSGLAQDYEIHALGDQHYVKTTVTVSGTTVGSKLVVALNADYTEALRSIDVSSGLIAHGSSTNEGRLLSNFKNYVFSAGLPAVGTPMVAAPALRLELIPNPANGSTTLKLPYADAATVTVTDICGRVVRTIEKPAGQQNVQITPGDKGIYFVRASSNGKKTEVERLLIN